MKISDQIAKYLSENGFRFAAGVSGGAVMHLMHSIFSEPGLYTIFTHHEQSAGMAAEAFARRNDGFALTFATSGPGATNLLTAVAGAYYDSVPLLCITGQVSTFRQVGDTGARQIGFQETPVAEIFNTVTKASFKINTVEDLAEKLPLALHIMNEGRKGPVLLDIPDDLLRSESEVRFATQEQEKKVTKERDSSIDLEVAQIAKLLEKSRRPILVLGAGLNQSRERLKVSQLVNTLKIPTVLTWGAADILPASHPNRVGLFGTHGQRHANLAIYNSDLVISIGSKLDTKATGTPISNFAPNSVKIIVDIDPAETNKFHNWNLNFDKQINLDGFPILQKLSTLNLPGKELWSKWQIQINQTKSVIAEWEKTNIQKGLARNQVLPEKVFEQISFFSKDYSHFYLDTGNSLPWFLNNFEVELGQRIWHDFNNTAMGWAIPAALSNSITPDVKACLIVGDGSFMMNIQDLTTLAAKVPGIKIVLIDNNGYSMIKQTQDQWLEGMHVGSGSRDLKFPNFKKVAQSAELKYFHIRKERQIKRQISQFFKANESSMLHIEIDSSQSVAPMTNFGWEIFDMHPLLPREMLTELTMKFQR